MSKVLFNIDDLALILVVSSCLLFIIVLLYKGEHQAHRRWLVLFLSCIGLAALSTLLYWSPLIRRELASYQPHLFLALQTTVLSAPPALYLYTRSLIYGQPTNTPALLKYFAPALIYICGLPLFYLSMSPQKIATGELDYAVLYNNSLFFVFTWLQHGIKIGYSLATLRLLQRHRHALMQTMSSLITVDTQWLKLLIQGFLCLWSLQALAQLCHQVNWLGLAQGLALFGNYFLFGLVNLLLILSFSHAVARSPQAAAEANSLQIPDYSAEQVTRLQLTMQQRQPYLKPDLSLEELSKICSIPQRSLSAVINRHHGKNFFEYINQHRLQRAASLLADKHNTMSILDIMADAGFNSKSAFNRFFKKAEGMTPSQYRKRYRRV
ncbi:MAG: helix-turn-helix domain-containing protein [Cellvibrionaceae bacterium]|nr:helix-turn-helix domain-containing protein [Cellvibrionaceae bacterium]